MDELAPSTGCGCSRPTQARADWTTDAAVIGDLVLTHDMIAEGVHFLDTDPLASVGWKLIAVNLSDLAAKGAEPIAALMGVSLIGDSDWEE